MKTFRQHKGVLVCAVLATTAVVILSASMATAAYEQGSQRSQRQPQQYQSPTYQQQQSLQQGRRSDISQYRDPQLEQQVAQQLRQQGFGEEGQILILALGNRVILLGTVPDQNSRQRAEQVARQASRTQQIDNRLQVRRQARRIDDAQLEQSIEQQLPGDLAQDVQVQAQNGRITIQGSVQSWQDVADAIEAAFAAGAQEVTSRLSVGGRDQFGTQQQFDEYGQGRPSRYGREYGQDYDDDRDYGYERPMGRAYERTYDYDRYGRGTARTGRYAQRWQQTAQSRQLQQRLTSQLQNQIRDAEGITVLASDNAVFLFGRVRDDRAKEQAAELAENLSGIERVENKLVVSEEGWEQQDDAAIEDEIQDQFWWSPFVDGDNIQVRVSNGIATLSGRVDNFGEMAAAIENAYEGGARAVRNQLQISGRMTAGDQDFDADTGFYPPYGYTPGEQDESQWQDRDPQGRTTGQRGRQPMTSSDTRLAQQVAQQIRRQLSAEQNVEVIQPQSIYVMVRQGTVMLHGFVQDRNQKQQAEQIARSIRGVRNVQNDLQLTGTQGLAGQTGTPRGTQQMSASDRRLARQIEQRLQDRISGANINVTVSQGTATLQGSVQNNNHKQQAEQIARSISGVRSVRNNLTVGDQGDYQPYGYVPGGEDQSQQGMSGQQSRTGTGSQTQPRTGSGQTDQQMRASDTNLSQKIQQQLQDQLPDANIHVSVSQGTATLHGSVRDNTQKQKAEQIARSVSGVQNVQNSLTIGAQGTGQSRGQRGQQDQDTEDRFAAAGQQEAAGASDFALAQQVAQKLQQQLPGVQNVQAMRPDTIYVMASQGTVMLHGFVQDRNIEQEVEQIARSIQGVQDIQVDLSIGGEAGYFPPLGYTPGQEPSEDFGAAGQQMDMGLSGDEQCVQMLKQSVTEQNLQRIAQDVYVTCHDGRFALYGYVNSDEDKEQLERLTKQVPGITDVESSLIVRKEGWEQKSDSELKEDVESQLWWSPFVDSDKIEVSVQNGVVTLSGQVDDWDAMRAAVKNAFDGGARRVRSNIQYGQESAQRFGMQQRSGTRQSGNQRSRTN